MLHTLPAATLAGHEQWPDPENAALCCAKQPRSTAAKVALIHVAQLSVQIAGYDNERDVRVRRFVKTERCEVPLYNWYVTAGKLRREITLDESVITRVYDERGIACPPVEGDVRAPEAEFTAPTGDEGDALPDDGIVHGWVVLRDGRGGTAVRNFDVPMAD